MDRINFTVNNVPCSVGAELESWVTLNDYLRQQLHLYGTKYMCREGGCGTCIVTVTAPHPNTGALQTFSVNSCLVSITSCEGWAITTVEEIGNKLKGYHKVQKVLAENNGTQCGYCTPGWVMAMYSLLQSGENLSAAKIENSFGSNICRCTGYRPILDAFKSLTSDKEAHVPDIEDLNLCHRNKHQSGQKENELCLLKKEDVTTITKSIQLKDGKKWFKVSTVQDIFSVLSEQGTDSYMLVAGNTAKGAYPISEYPDVLVDISTVSELKSYVMDQNLILGAGSTITEMINIFKEVAINEEYFGYLQTLNEHLDLVAHIPVRNIGTIAGNLMTKHQHNEFPSDLFLLFETVGARLTIENNKGVRSLPTLEMFLNLDMKNQVLINVILPPLSVQTKLATYKVMKRSQNAHAIINAGFMYKISNHDNKVIEAKIVYGGLSPQFTHAKKTEAFLIGKHLFDNNTLQEALRVLNEEIIVEETPPAPSPISRKKIALGLFYKGLLKLCPCDILGEKYKSGAENLRSTRPVSKGKQVFDTNPVLWPLTQPVHKVEAMIQCAGEAPFINDIPKAPGELYAAFVLSTVCKATIKNIDASKALKMKGVIAFYCAKDIPGLNSFTPLSLKPLNTFTEEVFCEGTVKYFNQPIGVIVAETEYIAQHATDFVEVEYENVSKPVLFIPEARTDPTRVKIIAAITATDRGSDVQKIIKNTMHIYWQYHFTMELQTCLSIPTDDGIEVHSASQWLDAVQVAISEALNIEENSIDMKIRRLGGGFGAKISRATQVAVACSLVTLRLNKPCRFVVPLTTTMRAIGKRFPCTSEFESLTWYQDTEAEYVALSEGCREATFLCILLEELTGETMKGLKVYSDSQSAIRIAENPVHHKRTKHIDVRHNYVREMVRLGKVNLCYMPTCEMPADVLTKGLPREKHERCMRDMNVGVNKSGEIQYLIHNLIEDNGYVINEPINSVSIPALNNCYNKKRCDFTSIGVITDTPSNTWCRSPGYLEHIVMIEHIMEQISCELSLDPISVRLANLDQQHEVIKEMTESLKEKADYNKRLYDVKKFNLENRWKKRGLRYTAMVWPVPNFAYFTVSLSVYHKDGSVVVTHGGVEMGQGVNTKVVQVCAYTLKIPVKKVKVKATNVISNANSTMVGASYTSEAVCFGVIKCCNIIQERLNPLKATLDEKSWEALVAVAFKAGVNLVSNYVVTDNDIHEYNVYAVSLGEAELDILTGEMEVLRVDLLEDVGQSLSPEIDVGQIEGAFIMGLGYWTSEELVYDKTTGELLTDRTWDYHVPGAKDIPIDFRVYFKRNSYNQLGVLGSKATGEPAICTSVVVAFALRAAIAASRQDSGYPVDQWFDIDGPFTTTKMVLAADAKLSEFKFNDNV